MEWEGKEKGKERESKRERKSKRGRRERHEGKIRKETRISGKKKGEKIQCAVIRGLELKYFTLFLSNKS